jgi:predicted AlkP superfamily phosphohydrolase/phosphomutase
MDRLLKEFGYLDFSASSHVFGPMQWGPMRKVARKVYDTLGLHGKVALPQSVNWSKTKAYTTIRSTGEGVSINLAGREIDGIVDPGDYDKVRDELLDRLGSFVDSKTGKTPVKEIYKREEIFKGRFADTAPDILMVPNEGYSLTHSKTALEDADWVSGDHRIEGTIVAVGPNVKPFESPPALIDMAPTLVAALGAPTAVHPTGRVLQELLGADAHLEAREASSGGIPGMDANESAVTDNEADEMEEHLRGLGYIE